ncbi:MAG: hypothetical protein FWD17_16580 [Polyangiaceae bacterium]|nr:hypothetical protein [Polyangiaceae bacterium]
MPKFEIRSTAAILCLLLEAGCSKTGGLGDGCKLGDSWLGDGTCDDGLVCVFEEPQPPMAGDKSAFVCEQCDITDQARACGSLAYCDNGHCRPCPDGGMNCEVPGAWGTPCSTDSACIAPLICMGICDAPRDAGYTPKDAGTAEQ